MTYCGSQTIVKDGWTRERGFTKLRCRSWNCPDCAPARKRQLIAEVIGGRPNRFLTLTIRKTEGLEPEKALERLNAAWRLLRMRLVRQYKLRSIPSFTVVEKHRSGFPHLHIFLRCPFIPWHVIRDHMLDLLDSPHVHIKQIDRHGRAAAYAAKYCSKANARIGAKKRYYRSRDYDLRPDDFPTNSRTLFDCHMIVDRPFHKLIKDYEGYGYSIRYESAWTAIATPPASPSCRSP